VIELVGAGPRLCTKSESNVFRLKVFRIDLRHDQFIFKLAFHNEGVTASETGCLGITDLSLFVVVPHCHLERVRFVDSTGVGPLREMKITITL